MNEMELLGRGIQFLLELGDCPNLPLNTAGGNNFWENMECLDGLTLQKHIITGHCRILEGDKRIAWGAAPVMREKFRRLIRDSFLEPGDIIGITRKSRMSLYDHYAVYLGDGQVIHYCSNEGNRGDFSGRITIHQAPIKEFLKSDENYFVLFFEDAGHAPKKIFRKSEPYTVDSVYSNRLLYSEKKRFKLYSPEETIARAQSRIGEESYNLVLNNCEHFALWCKTGVSASFQVRKVILNLSEINEWMKESNHLLLSSRNGTKLVQNTR